jgi:hypothetical protein
MIEILLQPLQGYVYGSIPTRKNGREDQPLLTSETSLDEDAYPEANEEQKELLALMDEVMEDAKNNGIKIEISRLTREQVEYVQSKAALNVERNTTSLTATSCGGYVGTSWFGAPLLSLVLTVSVAVGGIIVIDKSGIIPIEDIEVMFQMCIRLVFPGIAAVVGFMGAWDQFFRDCHCFPRKFAPFRVLPGQNKQLSKV